jgi:threonine dehydrogenase-like Zn-dependent dehydrogenase
MDANTQLTNESFLGANGGLADYLIVEAGNARRIPDNMSLELAGKWHRYRAMMSKVESTKTHTVETALVEPLAVGWHAVRTHVPHGCSSALVIGAGPIGLAIVQALRARGVETIILADTNSAKKDYASRAGAQHFINSLEEDVVLSCVKFARGSAGVQFAFDTAGKQATLDQCVGSLRVGGTVVNLAIWGGSASVMPNAFTLGEKKYSGSAVYVEKDFDEVISAISTGNFELLPTQKHTLTSKLRRHRSGLHGDIEDRVGRFC